jgi:hypothetical protein
MVPSRKWWEIRGGVVSSVFSHAATFSRPFGVLATARGERPPSAGTGSSSTRR